MFQLEKFPQFLSIDFGMSIHLPEVKSSLDAEEMPE